MRRLTIDGTLTMLSALIDWRDDSARCHAVFKSADGAALEVEYRVALSDPLLKTLAHAFTVAGVPLLRAPEVPVTLPEPERAVRVDRRRREFRHLRTADRDARPPERAEIPRGEPDGEGNPGHRELLP